MHFYTLIRLLVVTVLSFSLIACGSWTRHKVHHKLADNSRTLPKKVVIIPSDVRVYEVQAGNVTEEVGEWTSAATGHADTGIVEIANETAKFEVVKLGDLTEEEKAKLKEYVALYDRVQQNARMLFDPVWRDKYERFDYTIGGGLSFLREKTGADAAILVAGQDYVFSAGRKAVGVMMILVGAAAGVQVNTPVGGASYVTSGVVDLEHGDVLWLDYNFSQTSQLREREDMRDMLKGMMTNYPGIEAYKKATAK